MSNQSRNSVKRKLIDDENSESSKQLDKSLHLLRICDEFDDDEVDAEDENDNRKEKHMESLRKEIVQWKKLLNDSKDSGASGSISSSSSNSSNGNDSYQDIFKDYEKILSGEQLQYIRSAVDYKKWLTESNEFRKQIAYYLAKRKYHKLMSADFEADVLTRIEAVATSDYVDNFALNHFPR